MAKKKPNQPDTTPKVSSIAYNKNGVTMEWYITDQSVDFHHQMESTDIPYPAFVNAWRGFAAHVVEILGLPPEFIQGLTVTKLNIKHLGDLEHRHHGLTISFSKTLEKASGPFNATTPYVTANEGAEVSRMSPELQVQLVMMLEAANAYRVGQRTKREPDLFDGARPADENAEGDVTFPNEDQLQAIRDGIHKHAPAAFAGVVADYGHTVTISTSDGQSTTIGASGDISSEMYAEACRLVQNEGKCSTSFLQRTMKIGYNRAADLVDLMEAKGLVSAPNHVGKRELLAGSAA